jgi:hypothetical protein
MNSRTLLGGPSTRFGYFEVVHMNAFDFEKKDMRKYFETTEVIGPQTLLKKKQR